VTGRGALGPRASGPWALGLAVSTISNVVPAPHQVRGRLRPGPSPETRCLAVRGRKEVYSPRRTRLHRSGMGPGSSCAQPAPDLIPTRFTHPWPGSPRPSRRSLRELLRVRRAYSNIAVGPHGEERCVAPRLEPWGPGHGSARTRRCVNTIGLDPGSRTTRKAKLSLMLDTYGSEDPRSAKGVGARTFRSAPCAAEHKGRL